MKTSFLFMTLNALLFMQCTRTQVDPPPLAPIHPTVDNYYGMEITDPYQYMENPEDSAFNAWLKFNSEYSGTIFKNIEARQDLIDKMYEYDRRSTATISNLNITKNDKYFYLKTNPEDETGKLYFRNGFNGKEKFIYDPESLSDDSLNYVINDINPSLDGKYVAFGLTANGTEVSTVLVIQVDRDELLPERIQNVFWITSWLPDNQGFLYLRYGADDFHDANYYVGSKTYLHNLGSDESDDRLFFSRELYPELNMDPTTMPVAFYDSESTMIYCMATSVDNRMEAFYASSDQLQKEKINWKPLCTKEDKVNGWYAGESEIYFYTYADAPNYKLIKTSSVNPDIAHAVTVVPEDPEQTLTGLTLSRDGIFYTMKKNGVQEKLYFKAFSSDVPQELNLPFPAGTITINNRGEKHSEIWATLTGWTQPNQRFRYDRVNDEFIPENLSEVPEFPEYKNLVVEEVMVKSHDGVEVPLSIIYSDKINRNGKNPLLLAGYGAYGYSYEPYFEPNLLLWCSEGGIYAVAHVRGGGELGEQWYRAGFKTTKSNTWKDFIACAEYMIENSYTSSEKIAIHGGSAGGVLVGRAMTERPDLFAAAIPEVGVMNTLRAELEPSGPVNIPEFGTVQDSIEFLALLEMDSYHHLKEGVRYPATLIIGGMNDPRVAIWNPGKFAARMQAFNESDNPVIFKVDYESGHGWYNTKSKVIESYADILSFALWNTGNKKYKPDLAWNGRQEKQIPVN